MTATRPSPNPMRTVPGWRIEERIHPSPRLTGKRPRPYWVGRYNYVADQCPTAEAALAAYRARPRFGQVLGELRARPITLNQPAR